MISKKKKETDLEGINKLAELLILSPISLDVKVALDGVNVECKVNEIAKTLLLDIFGVSEDDFESITDIMRKRGQEIGQEIGTVLGKYTNESKKKDKEQPVTA